MTAQRQENKGWRRNGLCWRLSAVLAAGVGPRSASRAATTERVVVDRHTGLAIDGFDPVAYFTDAEPCQGSADVEAQQCRRDLALPQ